MGNLTDRDNIEFLKKVRGIKEGFSPIEIDNKLRSIDLELRKCDAISSDVKTETLVSDDEATKQLVSGKKFMDAYFELHPILHMKESDYLSLCDNIKKMNKWEAIAKINDLTMEINPFDLPVNFTECDEGSCLYIPVFYSKDDNFLERLYLFFFSIDITKIVFSDISHMYVHELAHTQISSVKGALESNYNEEVISLFLQFISANHIDPSRSLLKNLEICNLRLLHECINIMNSGGIDYDDAMECSQLIVFHLKALRLLDEYEKLPNIYEKLDVMYGIQDIFDGKMTVEKFLKESGINFENSKDIALIKRRIKRLS